MEHAATSRTADALLPHPGASVPSFHGLFVGINRYLHPDVDDLSAAVRDAEALHALFSDNLGHGATLLLDHEATRRRLVAELERLATTSTMDGIVVIAYSGHGSRTHELVPADADPADLAATALPLDVLTDLVSVVPARLLLVVLDCCFSGAAGAKVLTAPTARAVDGSAGRVGKLLAMAGRGRIILTAAAADQPAFEDPRLGHGLLTHALLEGLTGAEQVRQAGRVPVYRLLSHVVDRVASGAAGYHSRQTPTLRGQVDGEPMWPVFAPGDLYRSRFPERVRGPVGPDPRGLAGLGLPAPAAEVLASRIGELNRLQMDAINQVGLLDGRNVLVVAPTSSGKTLLGELAALQAAGCGGRSVFLLPTKALVNDKFDAFERMYGPLGVRVIRATGDIGDQVPALLRGRFDFALLTYEKFTGLALAAPHLLGGLSVIVVDEVQTLVDPGRGPRLEFLLTLLRVRHAAGVRPQLVALSAVLGDLGGLDTWLDARVLLRSERPVPLAEGVLRPDGAWRLIDPADGAERTRTACLPEPRRGSAQDVVIPLVRRLVGEGKQVLVFRSTKAATRGCAAYLSRALGLPPAGAALEALPSGDPSGASRQLRDCLARGVAFHDSDLDRHERLAVEQAYRDRDSSIRVMVATTTLAQGVNTPAEAVVVVELDHPRGDLPATPYTVAEYKNIIGRAGRLAYAEAGESYLVVEGALDEGRKWSRYVMGTPEDVRSRLAGTAAEPEGLLLGVLATAPLAPEGCDTPAGLTPEDAVRFLDLSLAAHQARREGRPEVFSSEQLRGVIDRLVHHDLARADPEGRLHLTDLGRLGAGGTVSAATLVRLVDGLRYLPHELFADPVAGPAVLITAAQLTEELDDVHIPVNRKGWQKESQQLLGELWRSGAGPVLARLQQADRGTVLARAKRAVACLLWVQGVPMETIERLITAHLPVSDAAGPIRGAAGRTRDVLEVVGAVAGFLHPDALDIGAVVKRLAVQLELGVGADLVPLAGQLGQALSRGDYLSLAGAGLSAPEAVLGADQRLRDLLGPLADRVSAAARRALDRRPAADEHGISHYLPAAGGR